MPPWLMPVISGITSLLGIGAGAVSNNFTNDVNYQMNQETNEMNYKIAKETNAMNERVANQNLGFQQQNLDYQKALQQQIFNREDTSYQRTASDMLAAGLNPLTMQGTNGAGEVIATSPLQNNFQAQQSNPMVANKHQSYDYANQLINAANSLFSNLESAMTGSKQRDLLQTQIDKNKYDYNRNIYNNMFEDYAHGFYYDDKNNDIKVIDDDAFDKYLKSRTLDEDLKSINLKNLVREYKYKVKIGRYDSDTDFEKAMTSIVEWLAGDRGEEQFNKIAEKYPIVNLIRSYAQNLFSDKQSDIKTESTAKEPKGHKEIINGKTYWVMPNGEKYRLAYED